MLFHERNKRLIGLATLGGVYLPCVTKFIQNRFINNFFKVYAIIINSGLFFCALMAARHMIFLADNLIVRIMAANNVFNDFLCCGRAMFFNYNRDNAQALYDKWDDFFTGDEHEQKRKELLKEITGPNRKYIFGSAMFIQFMLVSWASEQFGHDNCQFSVPVGLPFNNQNPEYLIWATFIFIEFSLFGPMLLSVDALIMDPLTLISAELVRLRESLADILGVVKVTDDGRLLRNTEEMERPYQSKEELTSDFVVADKRLKFWIQEHQKVLLYHQHMLEVNHWPLALQLFSTTMTICLISFIVATNLLNPFDTLIALLFFVPNYVLFYITSTYGNLVNEQAADIFNSAFATSWSVYPLSIQKKLHIITMRTNYQVEIMIFKMFPLGSKTYFQIVQTAYSFYSFLRFLTSK